VRPVALDTNLLVYAGLEPASAKGAASRSFILRAVGGILPAHVLAELLAVVRRKRAERLEETVNDIERYRRSFVVVPTTIDVVASAAATSVRHRLQIWDSIVIAAAAAGGATHLLSEDMQDGLAVGELTLVNPFDPANDALLARLLPP
jgi:predicted nucleic acid-binding protein